MKSIDKGICPKTSQNDKSVMVMKADMTVSADEATRVANVQQSTKAC